MLLLEEGNQENGYIQQRGEAIEGIERTIAELGGIFGQLAQMVSEQSDMIQRIDANTEDIVDNVEGAQRELMKYWSRVQGNRWLVAKMFGVLMICEYLLSGLFFVLCRFTDTNLQSSCYGCSSLVRCACTGSSRRTGIFFWSHFCIIQPQQWAHFYKSQGFASITQGEQAAECCSFLLQTRLRL